VRILITGYKGQLGSTLMQALQHYTLEGIDLPETDIAKLEVVEAITNLRPNLVIHAAAITDVDGCAQDPEAAYLTNALGTRNVALGCLRAGAEMLYISTNEVFDGTKEEPYLEFDEPNPINAYGRSKLAGERLAQGLLHRLYIVRTAWLYGRGQRHFVERVLQLAQERSELRFVTDEVGSPTYVVDLAQAIAQLIETHAYGIYHFTNAGCCSRYDFAAKVLTLAGRDDVTLLPITSQDYVRASQPPARTCVGNLCGRALGITLRPWEEALSAYFAQRAREPR